MPVYIVIHWMYKIDSVWEDYADALARAEELSRYSWKVVVYEAATNTSRSVIHKVAL